MSEEQRYRRREPELVDARQWDGTLENLAELDAWINDGQPGGTYIDRNDRGYLTIRGALISETRVKEGEWLVREQWGCYDSWSDADFAATFEPVDGEER